MIMESVSEPVSDADPTVSRDVFGPGRVSALTMFAA
jgi:hypothetical protein